MPRAALALKGKIELYNGMYSQAAATLEKVNELQDEDADGHKLCTPRYDLYPHYREMFLPQHEDNCEVVFDIQYIPGASVQGLSHQMYRGNPPVGYPPLADRAGGQRWFAPEHDTSGWDRMRVPGNWDTTLAYGSYTGAAWYLTQFQAAPQPGRRYLLDFEGVATDAEVYLNGTRLGLHDFAFTRFGFDITEHLSEEGPNVLAVRVDNSFQVGATWNRGGIRRPVTLREVPRKGIRKLFVQADPDLARGNARVDVRVLLRRSPRGKRRTHRPRCRGAQRRPHPTACGRVERNPALGPHSPGAALELRYALSLPGRGSD